MSIGMKMHTLTNNVTISGQFTKWHMGRFTPPFVVYNSSIHKQVSTTCTQLIVSKLTEHQ